ncbi:mini-circle protein [Frankia sp. CcI49]|uniref:DinB family protein n=1 Tax=unclassified Frankia TaxID=2632575 RepID=UPI0006CA4CAF|nr:MULTISPECIES: DinB family protein [unclassified Frankia]KPM55966.1 mini-circle protein [Frankia sp. R43]ONH58167.1 mini-circle protein [Frankia sp. CcI49]
MQPPLLRPPAQRVMQATTAGERETLEAFLDFYRDVLVHKVRGVGDRDAGRRLLPSLTTLAGLVKHLTVVERDWFHRMVGGGPEATADGEGGTSWALAETDTVDSLLAEYDRACALSREIAAGYALDDVFAHPSAPQVSLRWIYVHMIEETARHTGHADIVRELTDGETGVLG